MFTKNYASSTWCLNELLEIHKSFKELYQIVIPVFYKVDPSDVRKQTGDFGKAFGETCKGKTEDEKRRWIRALADVANLAGEDFQNWCNEAEMIEKIANYVSNKLITPSNDCGDFIGIETHIERLISMLRFESKEARMIGILGPSGIGKTTIARHLYISLISRFHHRAFVSYKRTNQDDYGMRLSWEEQLLSEILRGKDIKIEKLGVVEQRLKHQKVLIVLDHVDDLELLRTLVGQIGWFGFESRVIVISKDKKLLKSHNINRVYEVDFPSEKLALQIFCRYAFGQNSPPHGFEKLAVEVAKLAGTLPSHLKKLGSSFIGMDKEEWVEKLTDLRNGLDAKIVSRYSASSTNAMPAGSANAQCSNSQPQSNMDASLGTNKLVHERTRTRNCFSKDPQSSTSVVSDSKEEEERIECGPGVYITLVAQRNGTKLLKDVSFTLREKKAQVAHAWWSENRRKTYEKYNICGSANGQCSNSQPQKHMDASPGTDTLVHDGTRIRNCFSKDPQRSTSVVSDSQVGEERIQCGPGVYITLVTQRDGTKLLKDVSFTLREKKAQIAHTWWSENWRKMYEKYNICGKLHK